MSWFGSRLKTMRESAGLTQTELASLAGMHKGGIAKLESGEREPTWLTVVALSRALEMPVTVFAPPAELPLAELSSPTPKRGRGRPKKA